MTWGKCGHERLWCCASLKPRYNCFRMKKFPVYAYGHDRLLKIRNTHLQAHATYAIAVPESEDDPIFNFSRDLKEVVNDKGKARRMCQPALLLLACVQHVTGGNTQGNPSMRHRHPQTNLRELVRPAFPGPFSSPKIRPSSSSPTSKTTRASRQK
jgi:hypothetical protein